MDEYHLKGQIMKTSVALVSIISIAFSSFTFAVDEQEQRDVIESQLGNNPSELIYQNVLNAYPELAPNILSVLLKQEGVNQQKAVQAAMIAAPEKALEIAQVAREAGVSNEDITSAALLAGIDPTLISEASAAGIGTEPAPEPVQEPTPPAPPSPPAVGGQGGGGNGVISPN